jgi:hypothetical protein
MKGLNFYIACPNKSCKGQFRVREIKKLLNNAEYNSMLTTIITERLNKDIEEIFDDKEINDILRMDSKLNSAKKLNSAQKDASEIRQIDPIFTSLSSNKKVRGNGPSQQGLVYLETSPITCNFEIGEHPSTISMNKHIAHMNFDNVENVNTQTFFEAGQLNHLERNTFMPNNFNINKFDNLRTINERYEESNEKLSKSYPKNNNINFNEPPRNSSSNKNTCLFCNKEIVVLDNSNLIRCTSQLCRGKKLYCRLCGSQLREEFIRSHFPQSPYKNICININTKY